MENNHETVNNISLNSIFLQVMFREKEDSHCYKSNSTQGRISQKNASYLPLKG